MHGRGVGHGPERADHTSDTGFKQSRCEAHGLIGQRQPCIAVSQAASTVKRIGARRSASRSRTVSRSSRAEH